MSRGQFRQNIYRRPYFLYRFLPATFNACRAGNLRWFPTLHPANFYPRVRVRWVFEFDDCSVNPPPAAICLIRITLRRLLLLRPAKSFCPPSPALIALQSHFRLMRLVASLSISLDRASSRFEVQSKHSQVPFSRTHHSFSQRQRLNPPHWSSSP